MTGWADLAVELDAWASEGRVAALWWRDDDAADATEPLEQLLDLAGKASVPLTLAVIPTGATPALCDLLAGYPNAELAQHGYAHLNHAGSGEKKIELGAHRPADHVIAELAAGWQALDQRFGNRLGFRLQPILVPPWNRIAPHLIPMLPELGYAGLSTFGARSRAEPVAGLRQINTHIDIMDWRGGRCFVGEDRALTLTVEQLCARRFGTVDDDEPTGLLTHHLVHDQGAWRFIGRLINEVAGHAAGRWLDAGALFKPAGNEE